MAQAIYDSKGRLTERIANTRRIYWNGDMLSIMHKHYSTTTNQELSEMLNVSVRVIQSKAKELGLTKNKEWLRNLRKSNVQWAFLRNKSLGFRTAFKPGNTIGMATRFKPKQQTT